jgi:hypothetical protein
VVIIAIFAMLVKMVANLYAVTSAQLLIICNASNYVSCDPIYFDILLIILIVRYIFLFIM